MSLLYRHHCRDFHCMDFSRYNIPCQLHRIGVHIRAGLDTDSHTFSKCATTIRAPLVSTWVKHDHRKILAPNRVDIYNSPYMTYILVLYYKTYPIQFSKYTLTRLPLVAYYLRLVGCRFMYLYHLTARLGSWCYAPSSKVMRFHVFLSTRM